MISAGVLDHQAWKKDAPGSYSTMACCLPSNYISALPAPGCFWPGCLEINAFSFWVHVEYETPFPNLKCEVPCS